MRIPALLHSRRALAIAAPLVVLALLATGIYARIASGGDAESPATSTDGVVSAAQSFGTGLAIPVEGAAAVRDTLVIAVTAAGQAEAARRTVLHPQVEGQVLRIAVGENAVVTQGQPLLQIDPADYRLAVTEAEAELREAQARFEEMTLFDDRIADAGIRSQRERIARARSGLDRAEVAVQRAQQQLARTVVRAPFSGRVANIRAVTGQYVRQADELLSVLAIDPIRLEVQVLESEIGLLSPGGAARVSFAAFPDRPVTGRIAAINPVVERGTRTATVIVNVPNPEGRILPGMYARVALDARRFPDRVLVPRAAVLERDRRTMLFVYEGDASAGRAKWRYVTTGLANDLLVEILEDADTETVRPGEIVLTGGHYTLVHDAQVRVVDDAGAAGGRPD
jgi:membrane fusion protein, multidrug efflux system